jgi:hypothetical protein
MESTFVVVSINKSHAIFERELGVRTPAAPTFALRRLEANDRMEQPMAATS